VMKPLKFIPRFQKWLPPLQPKPLKNIDVYYW